jgi:hypothetical protein
MGEGIVARETLEESFTFFFTENGPDPVSFTPVRNDADCTAYPL